MTAEGYVLHDPDTGRWYCYLWRRESDSTLTLDGQPANPAERPHWYWTDHRPAVGEWTWTARPKTSGWTLVDPAAASERYPVTLTPEQWEVRVGDDDDAPEGVLYRPLTEPGETCVEQVDLSGLLLLDGTPPPDHPGTWSADLPYELGNRPEYRHLFPGKLSGYRQALEKTLKELPGVRYVLEERRANGTWLTGNLEVTVQTPYDPVAVEHRPARNRDGSRSRSRKGHDVQVMYSTKLVVPAPPFVKGSNFAETVATWNAMMDRAIARVRGARELTRCGHCHGTGIAGTANDQAVSGQ